MATTKTPTRKKAAAKSKVKGRATKKSSVITKKKTPSSTRRSKKTTTSNLKKTPPKTKSKVASKVPHIPDWINIDLVNEYGRRISFRSNKALQDLAWRWKYTLAKRQRWKSKLGNEVQKRAIKDMNSVTPTDAVADLLAESEVVEIQVPYYFEDVGWEGRVTPWEYLLNTLSKTRYRDTPLTVVRYLDRIGRQPRKKPLSKQRVLYVQSAPGALADNYDFSSEEQLIRETLSNEPEILQNPTMDELEACIKSYNPDVIHLAGIDNHQARELLEDEGQLPDGWNVESDEPWDGMVFATAADEDIQAVPALQLAQVLNAGRNPVTLISANLYHSGARICSLSVAEGAEFSVGFQDTIDDAIAELFFREFCSAWSSEKLNTLHAFIAAVKSIRKAPTRLLGTGIVLWSGHSLCATTSERDLTVSSERLLKRKKTPISLSLKDDLSWLKIDIVPTKRLNYSLLHNSAGGLFKTFKFTKNREGTLKGVTVHVVLYLGTASHPFTCTFDITERTTELNDVIQVPLTSELIRTVQESLNTTVFVKITAGDILLKQQTLRVTLLPVDEWKDTDTDRLWLPSFVLPRDHAVESIIHRAQKHLVTLADDRTKGFDGYQSLDVDDPASMSDIDMQVQAIWSAVVHDFGIRYINPPPSYTEFGQRLRTPTQVLRAGYGTCIDLALLLASCLEYVDIHPVIFLLEGHAFTGYWRSDIEHEFFSQGAQQATPQMMRDAVGTTEESISWIMPSSSYPEIMQQINEDFLYPIETVGFTTHGSFWEAIDEGVENLRCREEFHSLIDIYAARLQFITPLPILE